MGKMKALSFFSPEKYGEKWNKTLNMKDTRGFPWHDVSMSLLASPCFSRSDSSEVVDNSGAEFLIRWVSEWVSHPVGWTFWDMGYKERGSKLFFFTLDLQPNTKTKLPPEVSLVFDWYIFYIFGGSSHTKPQQCGSGCRGLGLVGWMVDWLIG